MSKNMEKRIPIDDQDFHQMLKNKMRSLINEFEMTDDLSLLERQVVLASLLLRHSSHVKIVFAHELKENLASVKLGIIK